jgi:hypothetical protein
LNRAVAGFAAEDGIGWHEYENLDPSALLTNSNQTKPNYNILILFLLFTRAGLLAFLQHGLQQLDGVVFGRNRLILGLGHLSQESHKLHINRRDALHEVSLLALDLSRQPILENTRFNQSVQ